MIDSKQFYTKLTPDGLASRKKKVHTQKELSYLIKLLDKKDKILDLACGYGRFTIPLAKKGYNIEGIDITPSLIKKANQDAKKEKVRINFKIGDMRQLPYKKDSFDKILCMWSAFIELPKKSDQLKAIKEMKRVLISGGFALIDMPVPVTKDMIIDYKEGGDKIIIKKDQKLITNAIIGNISANPSYRHNKSTLTNLMKECKIKKFKIFTDKYGGRERFFLQFWKK
jgi:ubiquinone/menaquinone biosynthesis C-methylase UbiE